MRPVEYQALIADFSWMPAEPHPSPAPRAEGRGAASSSDERPAEWDTDWIDLGGEG